MKILLLLIFLFLSFEKIAYSNEDDLKVVITPTRFEQSISKTNSFITVISESSSHYSEVVKKTNSSPEILQCFTTTGNGSHVLLALVKDTYSLEKLLRKIQSWPGVMRTETQIILSSYKGINPILIP